MIRIRCFVFCFVFGSSISHSVSNPAIWAASMVACRWASLKYAGTVMTALRTVCPRYASAASFSLRRIMAEISGGVKFLPSTSTFTRSVRPPTILYGTSFSSLSTSSCRRPMNRLMLYTVFVGFVTACRLAGSPTSRLPSLAKPTTLGVVRAPSWLAITFASLPSITATTLFVVPRSMPMIFSTDIGGSLCGVVGSGF